MGSSKQPPHVIIVGAGIGGLYLAQRLRKYGISYEIFERDAGVDARGAGWAIGLSGVEAFDNAMPDDVPPLRSTCHLLPLDLPSQFVIYPKGSPVRVGTEDTPTTPCVRANRKKLRDLLLTDVPVQWGKQAVRVEEQHADGAHKATVHFADGTSATGDLVVGVDGTWSGVRESVLGRPNRETLQPLPVSMITGETTLSGAAFEAQLRLGYSSYIAASPGVIFFCGLDRVAPDAHSGNFYWLLYMRDTDAAAPDHWLRTASREAKRDYLLKRVDEVGFEPHLTSIVRNASPADVSDAFILYYDAVFTDDVPKGSRTVLIGDAAHPTTPFRGEGAIVAIKDAHELSDLLATADMADDGFQALLDAFQLETLEYGAVVVQNSRNAMVGPSGGPSTGKHRSWGYDVRVIPPSTGPLGVAVEAADAVAK